MKKITFLLLLFYSEAEAQLNNISFAIFKKEFLFTKTKTCNNDSTSNVDIQIEDRLYVVKESRESYVALATPVGESCIQTISGKIIFVDSLSQTERRKLLNRYLRNIARGYKDAEKMDENDYVGSARDSIYEYYYAPLREQLTKSWITDNDPRLMVKWFQFLVNHPSDEGLNEKYLTICFLKYPQEFADLLNKQKPKIRKDIAHYMLGSAGFLYATSELGKDYDEAVMLFKSLTNFDESK